MKRKKYSKVVIVGRTNVGKSTLFNRLSEGVKSIALDYQGVTRDFIADTICWKDRCFELIDTGGISLRKTKDPIAEKIRTQALELIDQSVAVIFMVDALAGLLPEDREIAKALHKIGKPVILVVNKVDTRLGKEARYEFTRLGFKDHIDISAQHGVGIVDLFDAILAYVPADVVVEEQEPTSNVVILGKPNVGKSSLMNVLLNKERAIVADMPGTTREPIQEHFTFDKAAIQVTDTPGLRKKRKIEEPIEKIMAKTALKAVERADVVVLVVDAHAGTLVDQELKLAFYVFEKQHKGLVIAFNKDDLMDEEIHARLEWNLEPYEYFFDKIPQVRTSCKSKKNIGRLVKAVQAVSQRYHQTFSNDDLTVLFKEALVRRPLYRNKQRLKIHRVRQIRTAPITIELFVNEPKWFGPSQLAYFDGVLRKSFDLKGVPVRFVSQKGE